MKRRMQPAEGRNKSCALRALGFFFILPFVFGISRCQADEFGDISVTAGAMYSGNTFHGYAETRVTLRNLSGSRAHLVTLVYPNQTYGNYGNSISRLTRSVALAPGSRELVTLLQPPLPASGDGFIGVEVDGRQAGKIRAQNANTHCNFYSPGSRMATVFISRNLDFDAVRRALNAGRVAFTAAKAVGPPDARHSGIQANTWMPDTRHFGVTNWLELDYAKPQTASRITVYITEPPVFSGFIELLGASGTNILRLPFSASRNKSTGAGWEMEFSCSATAPIKRVRLDFGKSPPASIAIDAVEISGPSGHQWASDARASSDNSAAARGVYAGSGGASSVEGLRAEYPASEWSGNWLAYTPFDAIALQPGDLRSASPEAAGALSSYVRAGGNLFVFGENGVPRSWRTGRQRSLPDGNEYNVGFGHCFVLATGNPAALNPETIRTLRTAIGESARYWQSLPSDSVAANAALPVVKDLKIPTRSIVFIMLLFIIIIGPVNIIVLNRRKRRTWMLWTIPAISFAATLLVFAYSLLREGVTPTVRIAGVTLLNQPSHRAETIGAEGFYCPLTPSGGLHFDSDTEATPLVKIGSGAGNAREVDWSQSQHFSRGWVLARVPAIFHLRKCETSRARLQVEQIGGRLQIVNGLGAPITTMWLANGQGKIYRADHIPAGAKTTLIPVTGTPTRESSGAQFKIVPSPGARVSAQLGPAGLIHEVGFAFWNSQALSLPGGADSANQYLEPDTYIAVLDGNPFLENALGSAASPSHTKTSDVVFGILNPTGRP